MRTKFKLNKIEEKRAKDFESSLKNVYGEVGTIQYRFSCGSGIGITIKIYSELAGIEKDITDYDSW